MRLAPHVQEGQVVGFRVNPGRDRATFEALGLQAGDVVTDINGTVLDDPSQGLQVFQSLGESTQANVTVLRDGVPQVIVIDTTQLQSSPGESRVNVSKARPSRARQRAASVQPALLRHAALCTALVVGFAAPQVLRTATAAHGELPRSGHPHGRGASPAGHRAADHHRPARARAGDGAVERPDVGRRVLSAVPVGARGPRLRRSRLRQRDSDRARRERALRLRRRLRDASDRPRQHRRSAARADPAAVAAAIRASGRAPTVERADHRRSAAEHAPHDRARPAHGPGRHAGSRSHRARERFRRRGRAHARVS